MRSFGLYSFQCLIYESSYQKGQEEECHRAKQHSKREYDRKYLAQDRNIKWVANLSERIAIYLRNPPQTDPANPVPSREPILIADELEKLDALRKNGVLTQEEFDQQKKKLLAH